MASSTLIGVDIGGTKCLVARVTKEGVWHVSEPIPTAGPEETLDSLMDRIEDLGTGEAPVFGVACGSPMDAAKGIIMSPPNLPGWDDVRVTEMLTARFGGEAFLMNDADAAALAEWQFGAGQGMRDMVFLTFGTGFGAGLILDGRLYGGAQGNAGEIGHVRLTPDGPVGYHKAGSAEGWCSGGGLVRRVEDLMRTGGLPADWEYRDGRSIIEAARAGNETAILLLRETGGMLGRALAVLVDILNPDMIVIGSLYVRAREWLEKPMRESLAEEALPANVAACRVVPAALGERLPEHQAIAVAAYRLGVLDRLKTNVE